MLGGAESSWGVLRSARGVEMLGVLRGCPGGAGWVLKGFRGCWGCLEGGGRCYGVLRGCLGSAEGC